jgi:uncharacterized protein
MRIVPIMGPPCGGKSTFARELYEPGDIIVDLDALAHALGYPHTHIRRDDLAHPAVVAAQRARASILKAVREDRRLGDGTALVVATDGIDGMNALRVDPGREHCHEMAERDERAPETHDEIDAWYARHVAAS